MFLGYFKLEEEAAKRYDEHVDSINLNSSACVLTQLPKRNFPKTVPFSSTVSKAAPPPPPPPSSAKRRRPSSRLENPVDDGARTVAAAVAAPNKRSRVASMGGLSAIASGSAILQDPPPPPPPSSAKRKEAGSTPRRRRPRDAEQEVLNSESEFGTSVGGSKYGNVKGGDNGDTPWEEVIKACVKGAPGKTIKLSVLKKAVISAVSSLQSQRDAPDHSPLETSAAMEVCFAAALANAGRRIEVLEASGTEEATMVRYLKKSKKRDSKSNRS